MADLIGTEKAVDQLFHDLEVLFEGFAPLIRDAEQGMRALPDELLLDIHIIGFLQLGQMKGQISLGQTCLIQQEDEIRTFNSRKISQNHKPSRLMDDLVDAEQPAQVRAVSLFLFTHLRFPARFFLGIDVKNGQRVSIQRQAWDLP